MTKERVREITSGLDWSIEDKVLLTNDEQILLIDTVINNRDYESAVAILWHGEKFAEKVVKEKYLSLKSFIVNTTDADAACLALPLASRSNERQILSQNEIDLLRSVALHTQNSSFAYTLLGYKWDKLNKKEIAELRKVIVNTNDAQFSFNFIQQLLQGYATALDLKIIESEIAELKKVASRTPLWAWRLLFSTSSENKHDEPVPLEKEEREKLKKIVTESQKPLLAYWMCSYLTDISAGERLVLKGIVSRTNDPEFACEVLCDTNFIAHLSEQERARLKALAVKTQDSHNAGNALIYIFDLTDQERTTLEEVKKSNKSANSKEGS